MKKSKLKGRSGHANRGTKRGAKNVVVSRKPTPVVAKSTPHKVRSGTIYWPDHIDEVRAIAAKGLDDEEMAQFLGVSPALYESWKAYYPRFEEAIEKGRTNADAQVVAALFKNAVGYTYTEDVVVRGRRGAMVLQKQTHVPAETNAQKFWLTNRAPDKWSHGASTVQHTSPDGRPVLVKQETKEEVIHSILGMITPQPDSDGDSRTPKLVGRKSAKA